MKLGDGNLPPFVGYLPPVVDGVLVELVNMSHKNYPPRRGRTGAQLSQDRKLAIDSLQMHFRQRPHQRAAEIVADAIHQQKPFCLYLRNFGLGPRVYPARDDPFGLPQVATTMSVGFDTAMQRSIESVVSPRVPAVCIQNPAGESGNLPAFIIGDEDWGPLARALVRNAGLIVIYFFSLTTGVGEELELIRSQSRQNAALVVIEEEDPFDDQTGVEAMFGVRRSEPPTLGAPMTDFPNQVRRSVGDDWTGVEAELARMSQSRLSPPVDARLELPAELAPPEPLRRYCTDAATKEFDAAIELIEKRQYEDAEDVLTRSIAYAHWGRDALGRAMTLMTLGQLNLVGFNAKGDAADYLRMALELCEEIRTTSPTAAKMWPVIESQLEKLRADAEATGQRRAP